jgi:O-succinylbenzoate synthase
MEMACTDLAARMAGIRLCERLGRVLRESVPVNALLTERDPVEAAEEARELVAQGYRCLKAKVAPDELDREDERLARIRAAVGADVGLRIDGNAASNVEEAIALIRRLARHRIEYVEQPVAEIADLARVRAAVAVPIAADESVTGPEAVDRVAEAGAADVIVVKPALLGLHTSAAIAARAAAHRLPVVVTSTLDTSIGIAAALHLAATLPEPVRACGLATVNLLSGDLVHRSLLPRHGCLELPSGDGGCGLGVAVDEAELRRWTRSS